MMMLGVSAFAQKKDKLRRGLWFSIDLDAGQTLLKQPEVLKPEDNIGSSLAGTLGLHIPAVRSLQVGLGFHLTGYGNPTDLHFWGAHADIRYSPFHKLEGLRFTARVGLSQHNKKNVITTVDADYDTKFWSNLALGWEFDRILGSPIGFYPSIGISYMPYSYQFPDSFNLSSGNRSGNSSQMLFFLRLSLTIN